MIDVNFMALVSCWFLFDRYREVKAGVAYAGNEKEKTDELGKRLDKLRAQVDQLLSQPGAQGKRFPSSRCASAIQIVRPLESMAEA